VKRSLEPVKTWDDMDKARLTAQYVTLATRNSPTRGIKSVDFPTLLTQHRDTTYNQRQLPHPNMTTRTVRLIFTFWPSNAEIVKTVDLPASARALESPETDTLKAAEAEGAWRQVIQDCTKPIKINHLEEFIATAGPACVICDKPKTTILYDEQSYLYDKEDLRIFHKVLPFCGSMKCQDEHAKQITAAADVLRANRQVGEESQLNACRVCGKKENLMKCARCRAVAYCRKECQKNDWAVHKIICQAVALQLR
jgi:hypothetical protein